MPCCCVCHSQGTLQEKTLKDGLVLPVFPATLEHVPPPLDPTAALKILRQMCVALGRIHGRGYCHNDVKVCVGPPGKGALNSGWVGTGD